MLDLETSFSQKCWLIVVAETVKLIGNRWDGNDLVIRQWTVVDIPPKNTWKVLMRIGFFNNRFFKSHNELKDQIFEVGMSKTSIEHKEPIFLGSLSSCTPKLQCCNLNTFSIPLSAIQTNMSWLKWILTVFAWHVVRKNLTNSVDQKCIHWGTGWCKAIAVIILQQTLATILYHEYYAIIMETLIREHLVFLKKKFW